jgi:hypothetical protein
MVGTLRAELPVTQVDRAEAHADERTVVAQAQRDPRAFAPLYAALFDPVYRYCLRCLGDREAGGTPRIARGSQICSVSSRPVSHDGPRSHPLASNFFGVGSLALLDDDAAAEKKHKHKKKTCKSGTKQCGKTCIVATDCCSSSKGGEGGACVSGKCNCMSGLKDCDGACIPADQCCGAGPDGKICNSGSCICDFTTFECPNGSCASRRCDASECPPAQECSEGICLCSGGSDAIASHGRITHSIAYFAPKWCC